MTFLDTEMINLVQARSIILAAQDRWSVPSSMSNTMLQVEETFMVKEYRHTHTHTHTHTHAHTHTHTQTGSMYCWAHSHLWNWKPIHKIGFKLVLELCLLSDQPWNFLFIEWSTTYVAFSNLEKFKAKYGCWWKIWYHLIGSYPMGRKNP